MQLRVYCCVYAVYVYRNAFTVILCHGNLSTYIVLSWTQTSTQSTVPADTSEELVGEGDGTGFGIGVVSFFFLQLFETDNKTIIVFL